MFTNNIKTLIEKTKDIFMFRQGSNLDNYITPPSVTSGSIMWGVLLRSAILILCGLLVVLYFEKREFAYFIAFIFWFSVVYPAYKQYNILNSRLDDLESDTLCGKCKFFIKESQLCSMLDEHISKDNIPCEGNLWEANPDSFK